MKAKYVILIIILLVIIFRRRGAVPMVKTDAQRNAELALINRDLNDRIDLLEKRVTQVVDGPLA